MEVISVFIGAVGMWKQINLETEFGNWHASENSTSWNSQEYKKVIVTGIEKLTRP